MICFKPALAGLLLFAGMTHAQGIESMSVSPDGQTVLISAANRVVYTVGADTLEVSSRRYIPEMVRQIIHSDDGALVYLRDEEEQLIAYNSADMAQVWRIEGADEVVYDGVNGVLAVLDEHWKDDSIRLVAADTGNQMTRVALGKIKSDMLALGPDAKSALILTQSSKSDVETSQEQPADLNKLQKAEFKQKTDGYVSTVITVDFDLGEFTTSESHYRVSYPHQVRMMGDKMMVLRSNIDSALVGADGSAKLIDLGEDYFNAAMVDNAGKTFVLTNGVDLRFVPVDGGSAEGLLTAQRLPGGPAEWVTATAEGKDGTLYFGTNASRLFKVSADRGSVQAVAVY
ncbi:MAG: hypothetical protein ACRBB0_04325 [Pelagimonas sp.]|uniref:hypothetical protein n=1 Tax=Pelagimonas sp. TaxID=2073170 RepID=UPI003D6B0CE3